MTDGYPNSVLLVTPRWTRNGGVGAHVLASAEVLARHGIEVSVLVARAESHEPPDGVTIHQSPELFDTQRPMDARLAPVSSLKPDVVHLHQVDHPDILEALRRRAPVLISAHAYAACTSGVHHFRPGHECDRPHGAGCVPNLALRGCAHTRHVKAVARTYLRMSRVLRALHGADLAVSYSAAVDRHLAVNGVSRRAIVPLFSTMATTSGSGHQTRRRVLFAGRVVKPKGVDVLVRAAREVDAEFVICGEGVGLEHVRMLARRLGVGERVRFDGWVDPQTLARELAEASIVVLPSVWPEPFGLVGIEALASGRPVVASMTGGICDWLENGVSGLGVQPGDPRALAGALNELLADPDRQSAMGAAGREMVAARFSPARHVEGLLRSYRSAHSNWLSERSQTSHA
jgi:glycosyltransferase involved in cell wall biosynthesis